MQTIGPVGPRAEPMRDRRGRDARGPRFLPGPLSPRGVPAARSRRDEFDALVVRAVDRLRERFAADLARLDFCVEDAPLLPDTWEEDEVPLTSVVRHDDGPATQVVLFRLPISHRSDGRRHLEDLVLTLLVEQLALLWRRDVDEIDPRT